jgi:large conductance mechanosensitive channel
VLQPATLGPDGKETVTEVAIGYGAAIQSFIELLIIAFVVFLVVRAMHKVVHQKPAAGPPPQEVLLGEIRDLLKEQKKPSKSKGD